MNALATVTIDDGTGTRWPGHVIGYRADGLALFQYTHPDGTAGGTVAAPRHLITGAPPAPKPVEFATAAASTTTAAGMTADRWTVLDLLLAAGPHGATDAELPAHLIEDRRTVERMGLCSYEGARRPGPEGKQLHVYTLSRAGRQAHRAWQLITITPTEGGNIA
jgi:hypothetical protein